MTLTRRGPLNLVLAALCAITVACALLIDRPLPFRVVVALLTLAIYVGIAVVLRRMLGRDERIVLWRDYWDVATMMNAVPKWWVEQIMQRRAEEFGG